MKTFAEQVAALKATRAEKEKEMREVAQKSVDEARSMDASEAEQFDTLESEIKRLDSDISRLSKLADMDKATAQAVDTTEKSGQPSQGGAQRLGRADGGARGFRTRRNRSRPRRQRRAGDRAAARRGL